MSDAKHTPTTWHVDGHNMAADCGANQAMTDLAPQLTALARAVRRAVANAAMRKLVRRKMRVKIKQRPGAMEQFKRRYVR